MFPKILSRDQVRRFDEVAIREFGMSPLVLMENAARGAVDFLCEQQGPTPASALIVCGPGNNGGDGLAMARHLYLRGWRVSVSLLPHRRLAPEAEANLAILRRTGVAIHAADCLSETGRDTLVGLADWLIDAMVGTGARLPLGEPYRTWIGVLNRAPGRRMSVDIPSGLDCDATGFPAGRGDDDSLVFRADITATFVAAKPVMETVAGKPFCGLIRIVDIGAPPEVLNHLEIDSRTNPASDHQGE
jgi:NAD(P)H-hydrate epimerase